MSVLIIIQVGQNGDYHDIDDMSILIIIQAGHNDDYHDDDENHDTYYTYSCDDHGDHIDH